MTEQALSRDDVVAIAGEIGDLKIADILSSGATAPELERAVAWWRGESDVMGEARDSLSGVEAVVFDILTGDEMPDEDER